MYNFDFDANDTPSCSFGEPVGSLIPMNTLVQDYIQLRHSNGNDQEGEKYLTAMQVAHCGELIRQKVDERELFWPLYDPYCVCYKEMMFCPHWSKPENRARFKAQWKAHWFQQYHHKRFEDGPRKIMDEMMTLGTYKWYNVFEAEDAKEMNEWDETSSHCYCGRRVFDCGVAMMIKKYREEGDPRGYAEVKTQYLDPTISPFPDHCYMQSPYLNSQYLPPLLPDRMKMLKNFQGFNKDVNFEIE